MSNLISLKGLLQSSLKGVQLSRKSSRLLTNWSQVRVLLYPKNSKSSMSFFFKGRTSKFFINRKSLFFVVLVTVNSCSFYSFCCLFSCFYLKTRKKTTKRWKKKNKKKKQIKNKQKGQKIKINKNNNQEKSKINKDN